MIEIKMSGRLAAVAVLGVFLLVVAGAAFAGWIVWRSQGGPSMGLAVAVAFGSAFGAMGVAMSLSVLAGRRSGRRITFRNVLPGVWLLIAGGSMSFVAVGLYAAHRVPMQGALLIGAVGLCMASWAGRGWPRGRKG